MKSLPPAGHSPVSPKGADSAASPPLLGKYAKSQNPPPEKPGSELVKKLDQNRRVRLDLQRSARALVCARGSAQGFEFPATYHRVANCRWQRLGTFAGVKISEQERAFLAGLETCGSVWACPMCTAVVQEQRRKEISQALDWADAESLQAVMVTFTFPHEATHVLAQLLEQQAQALQLLRNGSPWKRFKASIGYQGHIRSLELTYGQNGWHPHTHELFFVSSAVEADALQVRLTDLWESACVRAGLLDRNDVVQTYNFRLHAVDVKGWCTASDYLAKQDDSRHWGADRELAKSSTKQGRAKGQHPFGLLSAAASGDTVAGDRYLEFIESMKGKRQLVWSAGLKARVGIEEQSDDELASQVAEPAALLCMIPPGSWARILRLEKRGQLLQAAELGFRLDGIAGARQLLELFLTSLMKS